MNWQQIERAATWATLDSYVFSKGNLMNIKHTENAFNDHNEQWREEMEKMQEALADSQAIIEQMKTDLETLIQSWKELDHDK